MQQDESIRNGRKMTYQPTGESALRDYVRIVLIRKWLVLGILVVTVVSTLIYLQRTPPTYESQVLMMRETTSERLPADLIGLNLGTEQWSKGQELLLKSDILLADIKQELFSKYNIQISMDQLTKSLSIAPYERDNSVLELKANSDNAIGAQALADVASSVYIKNLSEMKRTEITQGMTFLKQQMDQFEKKIRETEKAVSDFLRNQDAGFARPTLTQTGIASSGLIEALGDMQSELSQTESEMELANSQLSSIEELIAEKKGLLKSSTTMELTSRMDQLQKKLVELQLELSTKLETLTEKDPEVVAVQRKIDIIQDQLKNEFDRLMANPDLIGTDPISELESLVQQSVTLSVQIKGFERKAILLSDKIEKFKAEHPELLSKEMEFVRLDRQRRVQEQTYSSLMSKYEDLRLLEQMKTSGVKIIGSAKLPEAPISPKKMQTMVMGVMLGLFLGIGFAFFLEYMDDSIKGKEHVERFLEIPVLSAIPKMDTVKLSKGVLNQIRNMTSASSSDSNSSETLNDNRAARVRRHSGDSKERIQNVERLLAHSLLYAPSRSGRNPSIESYRSLATNIRYANIDKPLKSILVTSSMPGEGKTTTASNLAIVLAQSGLKTILVDADLRRPNEHRIFMEDREPGLSDIIVSDNDEQNLDSDNIIRPTKIDNLYLMTCGSRISNPGAVFPTEKMRNLIDSLEQQYDMVIIDSPPLASAADSLNLSTEVDGVLLVIYSGETKRKVGIQAKESLESVNANIIGAVLNNVDLSKQYGYYYYYYRYYYSHYKYHSDDDVDDNY